MKIGIDISQLAYPNTGVANYLKSLVENLLILKSDNEFILFYSSLRKELPEFELLSKNLSNVTVVRFRFPLIFLDFIWNKLHIFPIENLIGKVDIFITSDWVEPPTRLAKKATIIYDLIIYKYPQETHNQWEFNWKNFLIKANIVSLQKRKLKWVKKESDLIFTISESAKKDIVEILNIDPQKIKVIYPGSLNL